MAGKAYTRFELKQIVPNMRETLLHADGDGETIDVLGEMRQIESGIADLRKGTQVEFESHQQGDRWRIVVPSPNKRSYNTPRLVQKFAEAMGGSAWNAFVWLYQNDVIRLSWQFTKLQRAAAKWNVTLTTAQQEIGDGDEADIGVWKGKGYPSYERVE